MKTLNDVKSSVYEAIDCLRYANEDLTALSVNRQLTSEQTVLTSIALASARTSLEQAIKVCDRQQEVQGHG